jgi:hypothetical protein
LAEQLRRSSSAISDYERKYLKRYRHPPPNWVIFAGNVEGPVWSRNYARQGFGFSLLGGKQAQLVHDAITRFGEPQSYNAQITTLGMGKLYVQAFSCSISNILRDFEIAAKGRGMTRIWPPPLRLRPFSKGLTKFPTKIILTDEEADFVAEAFSARLKRLNSFATFSQRHSL